jgi:hypothetical protein
VCSFNDKGYQEALHTLPMADMGKWSGNGLNVVQSTVYISQQPPQAILLLVALQS